MLHTLIGRYTPDEESLKSQGNIPDFRCYIQVFLATKFSFVFLILGSVLACHLSMIFFFGADCTGQNEAIFFAAIQLCGFIFLKADLLAERPLSLVW
ncbi:hypothetical protein J7937_22520 [Vibrio parahaemolyticus]|nr:hypothetical protein [Vibrio parahaemolyticus]